IVVSVVLSSVFFFQAEDGIRDATVTGVQTCALPISGVVPATVAATAAVTALRVPARPCVAPGRTLVAILTGASDRRGRIDAGPEIGRASCRERVQISVCAVSGKKNEGRARRRRETHQ